MLISNMMLLINMVTNLQEIRFIHLFGYIYLVYFYLNI